MVTENPHDSINPTSVPLSRWDEIQTRSRSGDKDEIAKLDMCGRAYLTHFLDLDEQIVNRFLRRDPAAQLIVAETESRIRTYDPVEAISAFWGKVDEIYPGLHSRAERRFLETQCRYPFTATLFLLHIDRIGGELSDVIREINVNAQANK